MHTHLHAGRKSASYEEEVEVELPLGEQRSRVGSSPALIVKPERTARSWNIVTTSLSLSRLHARIQHVYACECVCPRATCGGTCCVCLSISSQLFSFTLYLNRNYIGRATVTSSSAFFGVGERNSMMPVVCGGRCRWESERTKRESTAAANFEVNSVRARAASSRQRHYLLTLRTLRCVYTLGLYCCGRERDDPRGSQVSHTHTHALCVYIMYVYSTAEQCPNGSCCRCCCFALQHLALAVMWCVCLPRHTSLVLANPCNTLKTTRPRRDIYTYSRPFKRR